MRMQKIVNALAQQVSKEHSISEELYAVLLDYFQYAYAAGMDDPQGKRRKNTYYLNKRKRRPVAMMDKNGKVLQKFPSVSSAAVFFNVDKTAISKVLRGVNKTCVGHRWKFLEEVV